MRDEGNVDKSERGGAENFQRKRGIRVGDVAQAVVGLVREGVRSA